MASVCRSPDCHGAGPKRSGCGVAEPVQADPGEPQIQHALPESENGTADNFREYRTFRVFAQSFRVSGANQARIEQRMTIRVTPSTRTVRPNMLMDLPSREIGPRFAERRIGKCLSVSGISGVQPDGGHELILYMRDRKIISARLERACRSRDFYSGFYLSRSSDGKLCVDRDTLQSRSGANCKLTRIRQLVEVGN